MAVYGVRCCVRAAGPIEDVNSLATNQIADPQAGHETTHASNVFVELTVYLFAGSIPLQRHAGGRGSGGSG